MSVSSARREAVEKIRRLPQQLEELVAELAPEELTARPLADEWTVAQNVHHLVDSHINSYVRCKLMATEENPTLKPYDEGAWARLADGISAGPVRLVDAAEGPPRPLGSVLGKSAGGGMAAHRSSPGKRRRHPRQAARPVRGARRSAPGSDPAHVGRA